MDYRVISLWQPWAAFVAYGLKTIETRGHDRFKGLARHRVAIHAAKHWDPSAAQVARTCGGHPDAVAEAMSMYGDHRGAILCTARVIECRWLTIKDNPRALCPCDSTRFGLLLEDIQPLFKPMPLRGRQSIFQADIPLNYFRGR